MLYESDCLFRLGCLTRGQLCFSLCYPAFTQTGFPPCNEEWQVPLEDNYPHLSHILTWDTMNHPLEVALSVAMKGVCLNSPSGTSKEWDHSGPVLAWLSTSVLQAQATHQSNKILHGMGVCFGLAWINARCLPKWLYHSPFSTGQGRESMMKGSWIEIRTGTLTNYHHRQNRLNLGRKGKCNLSPIKSQ